jgi:glycosylphosphatidylinositol transamidase (GPIT) subunit GPI8
VYFIISRFFSWYNRDEIVLVEGRPVTWAVLVAGSRGWDNYRHQVHFW